MRITSAFFADHVGIYEAKLCVLGGVWDHYTVPALPVTRVMSMALIAQVEPDDRGSTREIVVETGASSGTVVARREAPLVLDPSFAGELVSLAITFPAEFVELGRHVTQVFVDGDPQMSVPFEVRLPPS